MRAAAHETPRALSSRLSAGESSVYRPSRLGLESRPKKRPASYAATSRRRSPSCCLTEPSEGSEVATGSLRPAAASYPRMAAARTAPGSDACHSDSRPATNRLASSCLPGIGVPLMRRSAVRSMAGSFREDFALVHSSRSRMSHAVGAGVMAGSKARSVTYAARDRRSPG